MKSAILVFAGLTSVGGLLAAHAAQAHESAGQYWEGFYLGAHVGPAWADGTTFTMTDPDGAVPFGPIQSNMGRDTGALGGVQGGYNWQVMPHWVLGVEADWSWTDLSFTTRGLLPPADAVGEIPPGIAGTNFSAKQDVRGIGSVRGRFAFNTPKALIYATAGYAFADVKYDAGWTCVPDGCAIDISAATSFSRTLSGWVAGTGGEFKLTPESPWSIGVESLYYRFADTARSMTVISTGAGDCDAGTKCNPVAFKDLDVFTIRLRLNYKFSHVFTQR